MLVDFCENDDCNIAPFACRLLVAFETAVRFQDGFCAGEDCQLGNEHPSLERFQLIIKRSATLPAA
jgi:hypothetical protein